MGRCRSRGPFDVCVCVCVRARSFSIRRNGTGFRRVVTPRTKGAGRIGKKRSCCHFRGILQLYLQILFVKTKHCGFSARIAPLLALRPTSLDHRHRHSWRRCAPLQRASRVATAGNPLAAQRTGSNKKQTRMRRYCQCGPIHHITQTPKSAT